MKQVKKFRLTGKRFLPSGSCLMTLTAPDSECLAEVVPGQFVQVRIDNCATALLRRPISVCDVRYGSELILFVKPQGQGTRNLVNTPEGTEVDIMFPLGNGFTVDDSAGKRVLLAGGGVGAAPLVMLARELSRLGADVTVVLGGRSKNDVDGVKDMYETARRVEVSTDDGSEGHHGVVTLNPVFNEAYDRIYCCGPTPMMHAVAALARAKGTWCEVSLENHMACGVGACLCCVENTSDRGNVCVCTEGPVFNIKRLESWQ